jgi:D-glycero-D-manno-heptose 1,7-bisphosphate phosphatase
VRPAVFLDRDGVINRRHWRLVRKASEIEILRGVPEAAASLSRAGFVLAIVTNQEWVGRGPQRAAGRVGILDRLRAASGYIAHADHQAAMETCIRAIEDAGGKVARAYAALDSSNAKPRPDMLLQAARELGLDLAASFMVGDNRKDMVAGKLAGCRTVLVDPRLRTRVQRAALHSDHVCRDLPAAAAWILSSRRSQS